LERSLSLGGRGSRAYPAKPDIRLNHHHEFEDETLVFMGYFG
jgi:hypothetical protein